MQRVVPISDHERLIARWKQGDTRVAEMLYESHRDQAFRLAYGLLNRRTDAEDVAQEALSFALLNPERFDPSRGRFSSWLYGIVVRTCRNHLKRARRRERLMFWSWGSPQPDAEPTTAHTPEDAAALHQMQSHLWAAVQELPDLHKEAIILRMWGGHTYADIAQILGCPQRTAQSRVRLAIARLRERLGDDKLVWRNGEMTG